MSVSPLENRYGRSEVKLIFEEQNRANIMLRYEIAVAESESELHIIPAERLDPLLGVLKKGVDIKRMKEIEKETKHDIMSFLRTVREQSGASFPYLHFGLTSNDVNDSATAIQLKEFYSILYKDLKALQDAMINLVNKYSRQAMLGRTHGQHASPITFGLKAATWLDEITRHYERLWESERRVLVGKALGPVGTAAGMGKYGIQLNNLVNKKLGLFPEGATGQLVARDRYVEFLQLLAGMSVTMDKIGTEIRNLQRPEINEVMEYFDVKNQVGSSSMPSKRNPITCENICSLSRIIRAYVTPEMEGAVQWHERDLTNSGLERFTIPYSSILTDYILNKMAEILNTLYVNVDAMEKNLRDSPLCISERLTIDLARKNVDRQESHEIVRKISMDFYDNSKKLNEILKEGEFGKHFSQKEIDEILDPHNFIGSSHGICMEAVERARKIWEVNQ